jgi:hypothetical protein
MIGLLQSSCTKIRMYEYLVKKKKKNLYSAFDLLVSCWENNTYSFHMIQEKT